MELKYNYDRANKVIEFIEYLHVPHGKGAGKRFVLEEYEKKFITDIYAPHVWSEEDDCYKRVVTNAVLSVARKNGKTALLACLTLAHLIGPESEPNNELYSAANDREQAGIVFNYAAQIARSTPELQGMLKIVDSTKTMACFGNGSRYKALSRDVKTKHGQNPGFCVYDELAQSIDSELFETLDSSMGARFEPLFIVISTQSKDPLHVLSQMIDDGLNSNDPSVVCHLYALPDDWEEQGIDPYDPDVWSMANPALGKFLYTDYIAKKADRAKRLPSFENSFFNLHLNMRVDVQKSIVSRSEWIKCKDESADIPEGSKIYLGLDLSMKLDLTALVAVNADRNNDTVKPWFWKPLDTLAEHEKRDRVPYTIWKNNNFLFANSGKVVDSQAVALFLGELMNKYEIQGLAYDRYRMDVLIKELDRAGIDCYEGELNEGSGLRIIPWGQGYRDLTPAVEAFEESVINDNLRHDGNPVLTWNVSNSVSISDPAGNRKLDKDKSRFRIDGTVAMVMALGLKYRDLVDEVDLTDFLNEPVECHF